MPNTTDKKTNAQRIEELEATIARLSKMIENQKMADNEYVEVQEDKDISPNKKTKITSLTYGELSLYSPNRGFLKFENFGSTHTITYAQLMDYVNSCRKSTEMGRFYIHNQDMVVDLGLEEYYEKIVSPKLIEKVLESDEIDIQSVFGNMTEPQKESIGELVSQKVYNKEVSDLVKINAISKAIGIDIMKKSQEMEETKEFLH